MLRAAGLASMMQEVPRARAPSSTTLLSVSRLNLQLLFPGVTLIVDLTHEKKPLHIQALRKPVCSFMPNFNEPLETTGLPRRVLEVPVCRIGLLIPN